ncbi:Hypothetical predicted protein [Octopus vulgaris]|uniref:Uncharacterized protein n=1 Tax=Octopus vulgaris TaxID=6645 RepID=A0AA36ATN2_OCTVU|nr:Hypothetical predicted protein [Octopus vulgaris]
MWRKYEENNKGSERDLVKYKGRGGEMRSSKEALWLHYVLISIRINKQVVLAQLSLYYQGTQNSMLIRQTPPGLSGISQTKKKTKRLGEANRRRGSEANEKNINNYRLEGEKNPAAPEEATYRILSECLESVCLRKSPKPSARVPVVICLARCKACNQVAALSVVSGELSANGFIWGNKRVNSRTSEQAISRYGFMLIALLVDSDCCGQNRFALVFVDVAVLVMAMAFVDVITIDSGLAVDISNSRSSSCVECGCRGDIDVVVFARRGGHGSDSVGGCSCYSQY